MVRFSLDEWALSCVSCVGSDRCENPTLTCLAPPAGQPFLMPAPLLLTDSTGKLDAGFDGWFLLAQGFFFGFPLKMGVVEAFFIVGFITCVDEEQRTPSSESSRVQEVV